MDCDGGNRLSTPHFPTAHTLQIRRPQRTPHFCKSVPSPRFFRGTFDLASTLERFTMPTHKFQIGQLVQLDPAFSRNIPSGSYKITKRLPENRGEFEYRIKCVNELHERVVRESELRGV
jgi:hypothetical protein